MAGELVSVGVMNPQAMLAELNDPASDFYQHTELTPDAPIVASLRRMLESSRTDGAENSNVVLAAETDIDIEALRALARGTDDLWLEITVLDSQGQAVRLHANEFNAWQGTVGRAGAPDMFVDQWAAQDSVRVAIQSRAEEHRDGIHIENPIGSRRVVGAGYLTEPYTEITYGYVENIDRDPESSTFGERFLIGRDGELDVFIPPAILEQIDAGQSYNGSVLIKIRNEDGRNDPKVFYGMSDPREALLAEAASWSGDRIPYDGASIGERFDPPVMLPQRFIDGLANDHAGYIRLTGAQYAAYRHAMCENSEYRDMPVQDWIEHAYGTRQNFDRIFPGDGPLSLEEYHRRSSESNMVPRLGEYLGLNADQVAAVEANRGRPATMLFGESAVDLGLITEQQLNMALMHQSGDRRIAAVADMRRLADGVTYHGMNPPFFGTTAPQGEPDRLDGMMASANVAQLMAAVAARHPELAERFLGHVEQASMFASDLLNGQLTHLDARRDYVLQGLREILETSGEPLPNNLTVDQYITRVQAQMDGAIADVRAAERVREERDLEAPAVAVVPFIAAPDVQQR